MKNMFEPHPFEGTPGIIGGNCLTCLGPIIEPWHHVPAAPAKRVFTGTEWSPHIEAAAKAMYKRLKITKENPSKWRDLDIDAIDHYCIAAQHAVDAFHKSAIKEIEVEYS